VRLWLRLALALAGVALLPLGLAGAWALRVVGEQANEASKDALRREAQAEADLVSRWLSERLAGVRGWAGLYPDLGTEPDLHAGLLAAVQRAVPGASTVVLLDERGAPVVEPAFVEFKRASDLVARLPVAAALDHGIEIGVPYRYQDEPVPSLPVAVRATTGSPALVLGAEISLDVAMDLADRASYDHVVVLLDGRGGPIVGGDHPLTDARLLQPLLGTQAWVQKLRLADDVDVCGATAPVDLTDWTIAVLEPRSVVDRTAREIEAQLGWAVLASAALSVVAAFFLGRSMSAPIAALRDVVAQVGEGRFGVKAEVTRSDEIGDLARAFDRMSDKLATNQGEIEDQRAEIEAFNRELQSRVERRTRELRDAQDRLVRSGQLAAVAEVGAGLAHELNNPLAGILGAAQLLRSRDRDPRDARLLADLEAQAGRCREVLSTMLRISGATAEAGGVARADIREVLAEVVHLVAGAFRQRGVSLAWSPPAEVLAVRLDPTAASRLFAQILNALRAGLPDGAGVAISARRRAPGWVEVALRPDRPLALGDARDDWMAAGLGLWVARRLLDEVGGRLEEPSGTSDGTEEIDRTTLSALETVDAPWFVVLPEA
jgi:signal transduction histidine kinase